jgi:transposase
LIKKVEEKIEDGFITKINKIFHIGKKKSLLEK